MSGAEASGAPPDGADREPSSPLDAEQRAALAEAQERVKGFLGAARIAAMNGWSIGLFAAVSLLFGIFSLTSLVVGVGLAVVARNEFVGRSRIRAFDPSGLELLWKNQVGFLGLIVGYCLWSMYRVSVQPDPQLAELTTLLGPGTDDLVRDLSMLLYGSVILASAIVQGLNARYYRVRAARAREYLRDTPAWIVDLQRAAVAD